MADRYWVGGAGTWDATAGTKWATTSGGAGGASAPTASDNVFFDAASGSFTINAAGSSTANCLNLNCTGFTGNLGGGTAIIRGSVTLSSGGTYTNFAYTCQPPTGSTSTITSVGKSVATASAGVSGSTGVISLADALSVTGSFTLIGSTFQTNNFAMTVGTFNASNTTARTLSLGSSTVSVTGAGTAWNVSTTTNLTMTANTATVVFSSSAGLTVSAGGFHYNGMSMSFAGAGVPTLGGGGTLTNLSRQGTGVRTDGVDFSAAWTVTGTLTMHGHNSLNRLLVKSNLTGTARLITAGAVVTTNTDWADIWLAYSGTAFAGNVLTTNQIGVETNTTGFTGRTNTTISRSTTQARTGSASLAISAIASGAVYAADVGLGGTSGQPITPGNTLIASAWFKADTVARPCRVEIILYDSAGTLVNTLAPTAITSSTTTWMQSVYVGTIPTGVAYAKLVVTTTSQVAGSAGETHFVDDMALYTSAPSFDLSAITGLSGDAGGNTGITFTTPTTCYATSAGNWSGAQRWIGQSAPAWTLGGTGGNLLTANQSSVETDLTGLATNSATYTIARSTAQAKVGSASVAVTSTAAGEGAAIVTPTTAFGCTPGQTYFAAAAFRANTGTRNAQVAIYWYNSSGLFISAEFGLNTPTGTTWATLGVSATAPATAAYVQFVFYGKSATAAGEVTYVDEMGLWLVTGARVPLPQDDVVLDENTRTSGSAFVTLDMPRAGKTLTMTNFTGTFVTNVSSTIYGNLTLGSGMLFNASSSISLSGRGSHTIQSNGTTCGSALTLATAGSGSYTLSDALTWSAGRGFTFTSGTFASAGFAITGASITCTVNNTTSIDFSTSTVSLLGSSGFETWVNFSSTTAVVSAVNATFVLTTASTSTRTFAGGGRQWGTVIYTVANSPGALAITSSNKFAALNVGSGRGLTLTSNTLTTVDTWNVAGEVRDYVRLPNLNGNHLTAPDAAPLRLTGDIDLRCRVALDSWTAPTLTAYLIGRWAYDGSVSNQSYQMSVGTTGLLRMSTSLNGTLADTGQSSVSLASVGAVAGVPMWLRVTRNATTGVRTFYYSHQQTQDESQVVWTQMGATAAGTAGAVYAGTNVMAMGTNTSGSGVVAGELYRAQVRDGIGGTVVFDADLSTQTTGTDTFTESSSNAATVTIVGSLAQAGDGRVAVSASTPGTRAMLLATTAISSEYLTIKDIAAGVLPPWSLGGTGGNLLNANQSSIETDLTDVGSSTNSTVARSTAQAAHGTASLAVTTSPAAGTTEATWGFTTGNSVPVTAGQYYCASLAVKAATVSRSSGIYLRWGTAAGALVSTYGPAPYIPNTTTEWTTLTIAGIAPATTAYAILRSQTLLNAIGEINYFDKAGVFQPLTAYAGTTSTDSGNNLGWTYTAPPPTDQHESGGASASVSTAAIGDGVSVESATGGADASVPVAPSGAGNAVEAASAGADAAVQAGVVGAGTASESASSGSSASVTSSVLGTGSALESVSSGSAVSVATSAAGSGSAAESGTGGAAASLVVATEGTGSAVEAVQSGADALVVIIPAGAGSATESASAGAAATITVVVVGAGFKLGLRRDANFQASLATVDRSIDLGSHTRSVTLGSRTRRSVILEEQQ